MARDLGKLAERICQVAIAANAPFERLVRIAGLKPSIDFKGADLTGVDLGQTDISKYDFSNAILKGADLSRTTGFQSANLVGADLVGANRRLYSEPKTKQRHLEEILKFNPNINDPGPIGLIDFPFGATSAPIEQLARKATGQEITKRQYNAFVRSFIRTTFDELDAMASEQKLAVHLLQIAPRA